MGVVKNRQMTFGTVYERYDSNWGLIDKIGAIGFIRNFDERTFFIIHDLNGKLIKEANYYLNETIAGDNYKKRELAFTALKLFYSFIQLYQLENYKVDLRPIHINQLLLFLKGGKRKGNAWNLDISTTRRNGTINMYLHVYRDFYKKVFRVENNSLFDKTTVAHIHGRGMLGHTRTQKLERYSANKSVPNHQKMIPKYIKPHIFDTVLDVVKESYSLRDEIIIRLMYEYGLRLGEVLGITIEDIEYSTDGYYRLIIRNRLSDKPYQSAKGLLQINSIEDYSMSSYTDYKAGYHIVVIREGIKELIDEYIDETRDVFLLNKSPKKRKNLFERAIADRVSDTSISNEENQYIFLSHQNYTPLSASGWNYTLRKIFSIVGIKRDQQVRQNNLSHRFRHGFAMRKVKEGYTIEKLAEVMRHSSIESCRVYYNPDEEDVIEMLKKNDEMLKEKLNIEKETEPNPIQYNN